MSAQALGTNKRLDWRIMYAGLALAVLATPLIAMQFTGEVDWKAGDFLVMAAMLTALYIGIEIALYMSRTVLGRVLAVLACVLAFLTVWSELAVGLFD